MESPGFGHSTNMNDVVDRKEAAKIIEQQLSYRHTREELHDMGVLKSLDGVEGENIRRQLKAETEAKLNRRLQFRPNRNDLINQGILKNSFTSDLNPNFSQNRELVERRLVQERLKNKLATRPGSLEVINMGYMSVDGHIDAMVRHGMVPFQTVKEASVDDESQSIQPVSAIATIPPAPLVLAETLSTISESLSPSVATSSIQTPTTSSSIVGVKVTAAAADSSKNFQTACLGEVVRFRNLTFHSYNKKQRVREQQQNELINLQHHADLKHHVLSELTEFNDVESTSNASSICQTIDSNNLATVSNSPSSSSSAAVAAAAAPVYSLQTTSNKTMNSSSSSTLRLENCNVTTLRRYCRLLGLSLPRPQLKKCLIAVILPHLDRLRQILNNNYTSVNDQPMASFSSSSSINNNNKSNSSTTSTPQHYHNRQMSVPKCLPINDLFIATSATTQQQQQQQQYQIQAAPVPQQQSQQLQWNCLRHSASEPHFQLVDNNNQQHSASIIINSSPHPPPLHPVIDKVQIRNPNATHCQNHQSTRPVSSVIITSGNYQFNTNASSASADVGQEEEEKSCHFSLPWSNPNSLSTLSVEQDPLDVVLENISSLNQKRNDLRTQRENMNNEFISMQQWEVSNQLDADLLVVEEQLKECFHQANSIMMSRSIDQASSSIEDFPCNNRITFNSLSTDNNFITNTNTNSHSSTSHHVLTNDLYPNDNNSMAAFLSDIPTFEEASYLLQVSEEMDTKQTLFDLDEGNNTMSMMENNPMECDNNAIRMEVTATFADVHELFSCGINSPCMSLNTPMNVDPDDFANLLTDTQYSPLPCGFINNDMASRVMMETIDPTTVYPHYSMG